MKKITLLTTVILLIFAGKFNLFAQNTPPSGTPYITMSVTDNATVQINMTATEDNTSVWIETSTNNYTQIIVNTAETGFVNYTAAGNIIKIHGNIKIFNCKNNEQKLTALDFSEGLSNMEELYCSGNAINNLNILELSNLSWLYCSNNNIDNLNISNLNKLNFLRCSGNNISSLDFSTLNGLKYIKCSNNNISSLDLSTLEYLVFLYCANNNLTNLKISGLSNLEIISCYNNNLNNLNLSNLSKLTKLWCDNNNLTSLNVSDLIKLKELECDKNNLTTQAIDDIYCNLPLRESSDKGTLYIANNNEDDNFADILASNNQNAIDKNWNVWYYDNTSGNLHDTGVPTTGTYVCSNAIEEKANKVFTLYPNPATKYINIEFIDIAEHQISIIDNTGKVVYKLATRQQCISIDLSKLSKGLYLIKTENEVQKLVVK